MGNSRPLSLFVPENVLEIVAIKSRTSGLGIDNSYNVPQPGNLYPL